MCRSTSAIWIFGTRVDLWAHNLSARMGRRRRRLEVRGAMMNTPQQKVIRDVCMVLIWTQGPYPSQPDCTVVLSQANTLQAPGIAVAAPIMHYYGDSDAGRGAHVDSEVSLPNAAAPARGNRRVPP
jgi:hypothetical protein